MNPIDHQPVRLYAVDYDTAEALITEGNLKGCVDLPKIRLRELYKSGHTRFVHLKDGNICHLTLHYHNRPSRRELDAYKDNHPIDPSTSHSPCR